MDIKKLQKIAVDALEDIKAKDIEVLNTSKLTELFERIIIATGDSNRQVKALARNVHDSVKEAGGEVIGIEGEDAGEWVLVDLGDIVVHVMQPTVRAYYNLEELWKTVPKRASVKATTEAGKAAPKAKAVKPEATAKATTKPTTPRAVTPRKKAPATPAAKVPAKAPARPRKKAAEGAAGE